jgi:hypothetical protein
MEPAPMQGDPHMTSDNLCLSGDERLTAPDIIVQTSLVRFEGTWAYLEACTPAGKKVLRAARKAGVVRDDHNGRGATARARQDMKTLREWLNNKEGME